ncbi:MAG: PKD domain-containing protein, partial [Bacteroidota bacterium]
MRFYKLFTLLLLCCLGFNSQAQEITISGQVYFVTFDIPIPDVPVTLNYTDPVGNVLVQETMTDSSGMYSFTFENEISPTNPFGVAIVSTFDFCTGQEVTLGFDVGPENTNFENADFNLCAEVDPPDPNENCAAFFEAYPTPGEPNGFTFVDLSYSEQPITSWFWDFGDGTTSTEQNPEHVFAFEGGFDILLTITTDSCTSTTIGTVFAPHSDGCECPDIFQPVCVEVEGDTLSFSNICEAVCEGYEVDEVFECT